MTNDESVSAREPSAIEDSPVYPLWDTPRDGLPRVTDTPALLAQAARKLAEGTGPVGVDAERASGFRYGQRAFLVQLRREGSGTFLIDPEPFENLDSLHEALAGVEWILHASTQDLPGLAELGMWPDKLFDTELAARIAGLPKVGLAAVVEQLLGFTLAKEHSAVDWSERPLPEPWLNYAALDVDVLADVREKLVELLESQNKLEFALEEFEAIRTADAPEPRVDPWRRTSGVHQIRDRQQLAVVQELWEEREKIAQSRDIAPGRLVPDSAIIAAAKAMPRTVPQLLGTPGFHGRAAGKDAPRWIAAIATGRTRTNPPPLHRASNAPPPPRLWSDKDPQAAARLQTARARIATLSEELTIPAENILTPDYLRRLAWRPPEDISPAQIGAVLADMGARSWQVRLVADLISDAFTHPDPLPEKKSSPKS